MLKKLALATVLGYIAQYATATTSDDDLVYKVLPIESFHYETIKQIPPSECTRKTKKGDKISIHYDAALLSGGAVFDSTRAPHDRPFQFTLGKQETIAGLEKGVADMCVGETRRVSIPSQLGFGEKGWNGLVPPNTDLVYNIELLAFLGATKESRKETEGSVERNEKGSEL
ncbi:hypothetical protein BDR26DRAFT_1006019 [Obelidium mucronatum]|nr:hypothetical protein BDR26DRAFT_1006019 [Obelidium mucronatum]